MSGNRIELDEGMILRQVDPRLEEGYRRLKVSHFGHMGEWYARVLDGEIKGKLIQIPKDEILEKKIPSRFSDDNRWEKIKLSDETIPWFAVHIK